MCRFLIASVLFFILSGCSTAKKNAKALEEEGKFEEAVAQWERAVKESPSDKEAIRGLKEAQLGAINARLVQVRDLRASKEFTRAIRTLRDTVRLQEKWKVKLDANSASFQGREAQGLWLPFREELALTLSKQHVLGAAATFEDLRPIFSFVPAQEMSAEWNKIKAQGVKLCRGFRSESKYPYAMAFQQNTCRYFGEKRSFPLAVAPEQLDGLKVSFVFDGVDRTQEGLLQGALETGLKESVLYQLGAKRALALELRGRLEVQRRSQLVTLFHEYQVEESYEDWETVKKKGVNGAPATTERRKVKKKRTVRRQYPYPALKETQKIKLRAQSAVEWIGQSESIGESFEHTDEAISHEQNIPAIGLRPQKTKLPSVSTHLVPFAEKLQGQFTQDLNKMWERAFCVRPASDDELLEAEHVLRCQRLMKDKQQDFVQSWYLARHGSTPGELAKLLGNP